MSRSSLAKSIHSVSYSFQPSQEDYANLRILAASAGLERQHPKFYTLLQLVKNIHNG